MDRAASLEVLSAEMNGGAAAVEVGMVRCRLDAIGTRSGGRVPAAATRRPAGRRWQRDTPLLLPIVPPPLPATLHAHAGGQRCVEDNPGCGGAGGGRSQGDTDARF